MLEGGPAHHRGVERGCCNNAQMTAHRYPDPGSRSAALYGRARHLLPDGVSRSTLLVDPYPLYVERGEGAWVTDVDGHRYLDAHNNYTAVIAGHAHPAINAAVSEQLAKGTSFALATEAEVALAELLCARVPGFEQIRFCNSGTEAVMMAIKAARGFTGRARIAKVEGGYHGAYDAVEVSLDSDPTRWGDPASPASVPYAAGVPASVVADTVVLPFNDADAAVALIERHGPSLAAVLIDSLPSRVGMPEPVPGFLDAVADAARRVGAVFILDEVISFRLGPAGNQGRLGLRPDLTTLGKIIGGGFPVGAIAGRAEVMEVFASQAGARPRVPAGGTFSANSVTMVAGLACLELLDAAAFDHLDQVGAAIRAGMVGVLDELELVGQVTGAGSLWRLHPHRRQLRSYRDARSVGEEASLMAALHRELLRRGVYQTTYGLGCANLAFGPAELTHAETALRDALASLRPRWPRRAG